MPITLSARRLSSVPDPHPDKAVEYRQEAKSIRAMAQQLSLSESRNKLLDAAKDLEVMADEEDRKAQQAASQSEPEPDPLWQPS